MAKDKSNESAANVETQADTSSQTQTAPSAAAAAAQPNANLKHVKLVKELSACPADNVLKLAASDSRPAGTTMPRSQFIKHRWVIDKVDRGQITRDLNEMNTPENGGDGKKIPYQVVFAVIKKGTPGGPDKPAAGAQAA